MSEDRNFDDIADKLSANIYATSKGRVRETIVWQDILALLTALPQRPLHILDAGGGEGRMARRLAALGHHVTLCDISAEMIKRATNAAQEHSADGQQSLAHRMRFIHCPLQEIGSHLSQPVDLILLHAVLEWLAEPEEVLHLLQRCLCAEGVLSLLFYNKNGLLMRNILLGNLAYVEAGMPKRKRRSLSPENPLEPNLVYDWLMKMGMEITTKTGVRVFHDYLHDKGQRETETLLALEQRYCRQEPFLSLGRYIHVIARTTKRTKHE